MKRSHQLLLCDMLEETDWSRELQGILQAANSDWTIRRVVWRRDVTLDTLVPGPSLSVIFVLYRTSQLLEVKKMLRLANRSDVPIISVTEPDVISHASFLGDGVVDFLLLPLRKADVLARVERWLVHKSEVETTSANLSAEFALSQLIGESATFLKEVRKLPRFASCEASVFIAGETGTGKEICARALHHLSPRATGPFVAVNSGAIPVDLVENELFGHEPGAYTGAKGPQHGLVQEAETGTLFLDEIDSLPLPAQVKLLRLLQEHEYRALGSRKTRQANIRILAASNMDTHEALRSGRLRQDLYYRLNVLRMRLPPLRERKEDIALLARHFLSGHASQTCSGEQRQFSPAAIAKLERYDWPGNIRELKNVVERALLLTDDALILPEAVDLSTGPDQEAKALEPFRQVKARVVAQFERDYLREVLLSTNGNIAAAARMAVKNRRAFFALMRKHHITVSTAGSSETGQVKLVIEADKRVHPRQQL